jgi:hypothetical protein
MTLLTGACLVQQQQQRRHDNLSVHAASRRGSCDERRGEKLDVHAPLRRASLLAPLPPPPPTASRRRSLDDHHRGGRRYHQHLPGATDDRMMLDSESPIFPSCMWQGVD